MKADDDMGLSASDVLVRDDRWCVRDPAGGIWYPSEEAAEEIGRIATDAARDALLRICREQPMRGTWQS